MSDIEQEPSPDRHLYAGFMNQFKGQAMNSSDSKAREAFEARIRKLNSCTNLARQSESVGGQYRVKTVQRSWEDFQAALQWAASQQAAEGWTCPKCSIERHGPLIACMQDGYPAPPSTQGGADEQR
jgi:hypothetical protein